MQHYITLTAIDRQVTIASYVATIKYAKANPTVALKHGLDTWWQTTGAEIVQQFRRSVTDRINKRGGIVVLPYDWRNDARFLREMQRRVKRTCCWCGATLTSYNPNSDHNFCSADCARDYWM